MDLSLINRRGGTKELPMFTVRVSGDCYRRRIFGLSAGDWTMLAGGFGLAALAIWLL
jgi:hypothetical protein